MLIKNVGKHNRERLKWSAVIDAGDWCPLVLALDPEVRYVRYSWTLLYLVCDDMDGGQQNTSSAGRCVKRLLHLYMPGSYWKT